MRFASHKPGTHFRTLFCLSLFLLPVGLQAGNIVAVQDEEGRTVYVNIVKAGSSGTSTYKIVLRPIPDPKIGALVKSVSKAHQMDPKLVQAVIQVESDIPEAENVRYGWGSNWTLTLDFVSRSSTWMSKRGMMVSPGSA